MTEEHEQWVREHPATAEDIIGYLSDFATAKNLKLMISYGITIEQLIVPAADNMRLLIETVRGWAERSAWRLEPFVREGKPGLTSAYADLHVITYAADRWLDRYEEQDFVIQ